MGYSDEIPGSVAGVLATDFDANKFRKIESIDGYLKKVKTFDEVNGTEIKSQTAHNRITKFRPQYADASDAYANKTRYVLSIQHVPSKMQVYFKAFVTSFNETYKSDWASEHVFGRVDPIHSFKSTGRSITLNFNIPAASESEAYENLYKVGLLSDMLYPNYTQVGAAQTIAQSPLIRLKVVNLLMSQKALYSGFLKYQKENKEEFEKLSGRERAASSGRTFEELKESGTTNNAGSGALGIITSLTINHNLEKPDAGVIEFSKGTILPKVIEVSLSFDVIHETPRGWDNYWQQNMSGPYGISHPGDLKYAAPDRDFSETVTYNSKAHRRLAATQEAAEKGRVKALSDQQAEDEAAAKAQTLLGRMGTRRADRKENRKETTFGQRMEERTANFEEKLDSAHGSSQEWLVRNIAWIDWVD